MNKKDYRRLNAIDLTSEFSRITGGYVHKGRDPHLFRKLMDEQGIYPSQVLLGLLTFWKNHNTASKDVPTFIRAVDTWLVEDELEAATELALLLERQRTPGCYLLYLDFRETGQEGRTKIELESWLNDQFKRIDPSKRRTGAVSSRR